MASSLYNYSCAVCGLNFNGPIPYKAHMESIKHLKKEELQKVAQVEGNKENHLVFAMKDSPVNDVHFCDVCRIYVTGIIPWKQHIDGKSHLKKCKLFESMSSLSLSESVAPSQSSLPTTFKMKEHCEMCNPSKEKTAITDEVETKEDSHEESRDITLARESLQEMFIKPEAKNEVSEPASDENSMKSLHNITADDMTVLRTYSLHSMFQKFYCELCRVQCNGPVPFKHHISSYKHLHQEHLQTFDKDKSTDNASISSLSDAILHPNNNASDPMKRVISLQSTKEEEESLLLNKLTDVCSITIIGSDEPINLNL